MLKLRKIFACLIISVVLVVSLGGCSAKEGGVIKIGVFEPLTGVHMAGGQQELLGIRYAHAQKPTVTIDGKSYRIELVEMDTASDPAKAVDAANQLAASDVSVVLGTYGSACAIASGAVFAEKELPVIGASCTNPQVTLGNEFYFRVCFTDDFQGMAMANLAIEQGWAADQSGMKVGVLTQKDDDYSAGLSSLFASAFKNAGGEIIEISYTADEDDFESLVEDFDECDAIFAPSSIENGVNIIKAIRDVNEDCAILGGDSWDNSLLIRGCGDDATAVYFSTAFDEADETNETGKKFTEGFKKWLNEDAGNLELNSGSDAVSATSALGYDAYMAAIKALEKAEAIDRLSIRSAIKEVKFDGATGEISFDKKGNAKKDVAYIKTVDVAKGAFEFVMTQTVTE